MTGVPDENMDRLVQEVYPSTRVLRIAQSVEELQETASRLLHECPEILTLERIFKLQRKGGGLVMQAFDIQETAKRLEDSIFSFAVYSTLFEEDVESLKRLLPLTEEQHSPGKENYRQEASHNGDEVHSV